MQIVQEIHEQKSELSQNSVVIYSRMPGKSSPFTPEQESQIVLSYGRLQSIVKVRRWYRKQYNVRPRNVPANVQFSRVVQRSERTNTTKPGKSTGRPISA